MRERKFLDAALNKPEPGDKIEYFNNIKRRMNGYVLTENQRNQPQAGYCYEIDVTDMWEEYKKLKETCGYKLSFNTIIMKAMVEGLKAAPRLNAHIDFDHFRCCGTLTIKKHIDVSMPVMLDSGDTFPVKICNCEERNLQSLQEEINVMTQKMKNTDIDGVLFDLVIQRTVGFLLKGQIKKTVAQSVAGIVGKHKIGTFGGFFKKNATDGEKGLKYYHLNEGTVCFSNWAGLYEGLRGFETTSPLLYPQVFMMGVGGFIEKNFAFKNEKGEVDVKTRKMLPVTLTFDHRIGAFNDVIPFMKRMDEVFENPQEIHTW